MSRKKKFAICPACITERHRSEITVCLTILDRYERSQYKYYQELKVDSYQTLIDGDFEWACDDCLQSKKAVLASPLLQDTASSVNLAYADQNSKCRKCGSDFKFTKEEKRKWYETYKFHLDSTPVNCLNCRRQIRQLKAENKILSSILSKEKENVTLAEWQTVVDIYRNWDKPEKAKFYDAVIKKIR